MDSKGGSDEVSDRSEKYVLATEGKVTVFIKWQRS